jgi:hypothetical protein
VAEGRDMQSGDRAAEPRTNPVAKRESACDINST